MRSIEGKETDIGSYLYAKPPLGFGTYQLGKKQDREGAIRLMGHAFDRGIKLFDTSDNYGSAEIWIGEALRRGVLNANEIIIATKTGFARTKEEAQEFARRRIQQDASPRRIKVQVEASLKLLGIDSLDIYQIHAHDPNVQPLDIAITMNDLITEGKIKHWGISNYNDPSHISTLMTVCQEEELEAPISLQNHLSLFDQRYQKAIQTARQLGLSIFAWSPLKRGLITERLFSGSNHGINPEAIEKLRTIQKLARKKGANIQQLAIAWLIHNKAIPLLGTYNDEHFDDLIRAVDLEFDDKDLEIVNGALNEAMALT